MVPKGSGNTHIKDIIDGIKSLSSRLSVYTECADSKGLTLTELFFFEIMYQAERGCSVTELCELLDISEGKAGVMISKFRKKGYVDYYDPDGNKKERQVVFTVEGLFFADDLVAPLLDAETAAMAELSEVDVYKFVRISEIYSGILKDKFKEVRKYYH